MVSLTTFPFKNTRCQEQLGIQTLCLGSGCTKKQYVFICVLTLTCTYTNMLKTEIALDQDTHGTMLVPTLFGTDKTTVSVATGQNEYHPVYMSIGNVDNSVRCAHRDALLPIAFLAIPKGQH